MKKALDLLEKIEDDESLSANSVSSINTIIEISRSNKYVKDLGFLVKNSKKAEREVVQKVLEWAPFEMYDLKISALLILLSDSLKNESACAMSSVVIKGSIERHAKKVATSILLKDRMYG